jgi:hypothetical protein
MNKFKQKLAMKIAIYLIWRGHGNISGLPALHAPAGT